MKYLVKLSYKSNIYQVEINARDKEEPKNIAIIKSAHKFDRVNEVDINSIEVIDENTTN